MRVLKIGYGLFKGGIGLPRAWLRLRHELTKPVADESIFLTQSGKAIKRLQNLGVKYTILSPKGILARKKSDTLIVLGSGASINDIADNQWQFIERHDSIGFNFWFVHSFVPTFYHVEYLRDRYGLINYIAIMKQVEKRYRDVPFLMSTNTAYTGWHPKYRPEVFPQNVKLYVYPYGGVKIVPKDRSIETLDFSDLTTDLGEAPYIARGSLTTVVHLGFQMKYKRIILAGVDLNNRRYFYDDLDIMKWRSDLVDEKNEEHSTTVWNEGKYHAVDTFLPAFNEFVCKPKGAELFIASKSSLLYPSLRYHPLSDEVIV
jgi:hypothetical protein